MRRIIALLLAIVMMFSIASCGEYNPAEVKPDIPEVEQPDNGGGETQPPADGEYTFTATLMLGGKVFVPEPESDPERVLKVRWTDGSKYYTVPVGADGKAVCEGLDGVYSVTLVNLSDEYTYNPNIYHADNDNRDVIIELLTLSKGVGESIDELNCIEFETPGVYRATLKNEDHKVYFQFTPSRAGVYVIESMMDVSAGMYNPVLRMYSGHSQYKIPDEVIDGGGVSEGYTTNFRAVIIIPADSYVGNSYTFDIYVEGRDAVYPVNVDFDVSYKGSYDGYVETLKTYIAPTYIPKDGYNDWFEAYKAYLQSDREKFGNVYVDASVSIGSGKDAVYVFDSTNYRLSTKDGMHLNDLGEKVYDPFDPKDEYYHVYNADKYPFTGGWGPILYAAITIPTAPTSSPSKGGDPVPFIGSAFSSMEQAGNAALTLGEKGDLNYKIFIEGYYNIVSMAGDTESGGRGGGYYFCVEECPCRKTNGGACAIEDNCRQCNPNCRNIPRALIGQRGYADIAIDGKCPVTAELKDFLQKYCLKEQIFKDGSGLAEGQHDPVYHADQESMWLFACGYYTTA